MYELSSGKPQKNVDKIVFAGPSVAGAIRNQFNLVTNTVDSGTDWQFHER